jgi:hypothetical protein
MSGDKRVTKVLLLATLKRRGHKISGMSKMKKAELQKLLGAHPDRVFKKDCRVTKAGSPRIRRADGKCYVCPSDLNKRGSGPNVRCINLRSPRSPRAGSPKKLPKSLSDWTKAVKKARKDGSFAGVAKKGTPLYKAAKKLHMKMQK